MTREYYSQDLWKPYPFNWAEFFQWRDKQTNDNREEKTECKNNLSLNTAI